MNNVWIDLDLTGWDIVGLVVFFLVFQFLVGFFEAAIQDIRAALRQRKAR